MRIFIVAVLIRVFASIGVYVYVFDAPSSVPEKDIVLRDAVTESGMNPSAEDVEIVDRGGAASQFGGVYEPYVPEKIAGAKEGRVVLFFRASWCPTCRALDADTRSKLSSIPTDVTILDVNYDTETALKQKYGVTYQHTFVHVDASGNQIAKWSGSPTLAALLGNVK